MTTFTNISKDLFHPDHLGSSTLITDNFGDPYQFFLNLPFGETFAEQRRNGSFNNPYKFNGKELDPETGLYYYGARYYNPRTSVWLSVDPLAEHTMTPYQYTYQNPVKYIDPTGMAAEDPPPGTAEPYWKDDTGEYFLRTNNNSYAHLINGEYQGEFYIEPIELSLVVVNGKSNDQQYAFSNRCIKGCHSPGSKFENNSSSLIRNTSETLYNSSNGLVIAGKGFSSDFYRPGDEVKRVEMIPIGADAFGTGLFELLKHFNILKKNEKIIEGDKSFRIIDADSIYGGAGRRNNSFFKDTIIPFKGTYKQYYEKKREIDSIYYQKRFNDYLGW